MDAQTLNGVVIAGPLETSTGAGRRRNTWHVDPHLAATAVVGGLWVIGWFVATRELAAFVHAVSALPQ